MKPLLFIMLISSFLFAEDAAKPIPIAPALQEKDRAEIAILQRDFLIAQSDYKAAETKLQTVKDAMVAKYSQFGDLCKKAGQLFDPSKIACVARDITKEEKQ